MRVSKNPLHPALLRLEAENIDKAALKATMRAHPRRGFTCVIRKSDESATELLIAHGFSPVRSTLEGEWRPDSTASLPNFEHGTLAQQPDLLQPWLAAHRQHYFATHSTNPPATLSVQRWEGVFLAGDFSPESAFYVLDKNGIAAFSSLRTTKGNWELAWFGTVPENHPRFEVLNEGLIALETAYMAAHDIPSVFGEFDSTSPDAMWRLKRRNLVRPNAFQTYHLIR